MTHADEDAPLRLANELARQDLEEGTSSDSSIRDEEERDDSEEVEGSSGEEHTTSELERLKARGPGTDWQRGRKKRVERQKHARHAILESAGARHCQAKAMVEPNRKRKATVATNALARRDGKRQVKPTRKVAEQL